MGSELETYMVWRVIIEGVVRLLLVVGALYWLVTIPMKLWRQRRRRLWLEAQREAAQRTADE